MKTGFNKQSGVMLLEALIGVVIFSIGILAMIALQARAIAVQSDAQYRIEAAALIDQLLGDIALNVNRTSGPTVQASLANFQHQPLPQPAVPGNCTFTGAASNDPVVTNWLGVVQARLVGIAAPMVQVQVNTGAFNTVAVTLCWQTPNSATPNRHTVVAYIN